MPTILVTIVCGRKGCSTEAEHCHFLRPRSNEKGPSCTLRRIDGENEVLAENDGVPVRTSYCLHLEREANKQSIENHELIRNLQEDLRRTRSALHELELEHSTFELG